MASESKQRLFGFCDTIDQENYDFIQNPSKNQAKPFPISWKKEIQLSSRFFDFSKMLPGQILEKEFSVTNPTNSTMEMRIVVECLNKEFDNLDEYVFTLRSSESNNYHHRHRTLFVPFSRAFFKVAIKVPNVKENCQIKGKINLQFGKSGEKPTEEMDLPILAQAEIPNIHCPKVLEFNKNHCLRLLSKKGRKTDLKIPLRNDSDFDLSFNIEVISPDSDAILLPSGNGGYLAKQSSGVIMVGVRAALHGENRVSRKVLVLKVKGSTAIVSIPIEIEILP